MRIILLVFLTFVLTACGFKGPLYLPDPTVPPNKIRKPQPQQGERLFQTDTGLSLKSHPTFVEEKHGL